MGRKVQSQNACESVLNAESCERDVEAGSALANMLVNAITAEAA
jgi:hypothetical protein